MLRGVVFLGVVNRHFLEERAEITQNICWEAQQEHEAALDKHVSPEAGGCAGAGKTVNLRGACVFLRNSSVLLAGWVFFSW